MADRFYGRRNARRDKISGLRILCAKDILSPVTPESILK